MTPLSAAFAGRSVFVTGHTGFKGGWLCLWLSKLGAKVHGYALPPPTSPSLCDEARLPAVLASDSRSDIRDFGRLSQALHAARPEVIFHLAAQPLVRRSYREPRETWETNVLGTINVLEAIRATPGVKVCQIITSDKCYENAGQVCAFRETDAMGGHDPYSSSKGAAEIATAAWRRSFFEGGTSISSARAGNVIGGGDWAEDRIIPDCIRALERNEPIAVRNPNAVRPWQHVLEPLSGYLRLAAQQLAMPARFADSFNFGPHPSGNLTVGCVADLVVKHWGAGRWEHRPPPGQTAAHGPLHEAGFLKLDITKATTLLDWKPMFAPQEAIAETVSWYRGRNRDGTRFDARTACLDQIARYESRLAASA